MFRAPKTTIAKIKKKKKNRRMIMYIVFQLTERLSQVNDPTFWNLICSFSKPCSPVSTELCRAVQVALQLVSNCFKENLIFRKALSKTK